MTTESKPLPTPDDETRPFWEGAHNHQLVFQRCQYCYTYAHPPVDFCEHCHNLENPMFRFEPVSGRGTVVNWTVIHDAMVSGFDTEAPWAHILVEMEEQAGLWFTSTLIGPSGGLALGAPVEVAFEDVTDDVTLPYFRLTE